MRRCEMKGREEIEFILIDNRSFTSENKNDTLKSLKRFRGIRFLPIAILPEQIGAREIFKSF